MVDCNFIIQSMKRICFFVASFPMFLLKCLYRIILLLGNIFPENSTGCRIRGLIYKPLLKKCGKDFQVAIGVKLEHLYNIEVGNHVYIGCDTWVSGVRGGVKLEDEVMIGPKVCIVSSNHTSKDGSYRFGPGIGKPIVVGKGTWIASNVTITAGVILGNNCLVAAGAVVKTGLYPDNCVLGGIPAKILNAKK